MNMKIFLLYLLQAVILGNLFISCLAKNKQEYNENVLNQIEIQAIESSKETLVDTLTIVASFMEDIDNLLNKCNPGLIDENTFGDCIYE